jgi:BirA family biotin operon repressor/biotin-[acetyl-CoA-carboxylase] ligase
MFFIDCHRIELCAVYPKFVRLKNRNLLPHPANRPVRERAQAIGYSLEQLETVDSTNNYALAKVQAGEATHGSAYLAREQTAGKGQRGRRWLSRPGESILLSIVLEPLFLRANQQFLLTASVALAALDWLQSNCPGETSIKWPNDIYWRDRKAGGILTETLYRGKKIRYAVVGIGININQLTFPGDLPNPISLAQITGSQRSIPPLALELCAFLEHRYRQLQKGDSEILLKAYNASLYRRGQKILLKHQGRQMDTILRSVTAQGDLVGGEGRRFRFGEVEWVQG